jgi:integrase
MWRFRWWDKTGKRRAEIIGTLDEYPTESVVQKCHKLAYLRSRINTEAPCEEIVNFGIVIERYLNEEIPKRFATNHSYLSYIRNHIQPRWENVPISKLTPLAVRDWLKNATAKDDRRELAGKTKGHLRGLMHILFDRAMLWGYLPMQRNPIELVHISGSSKRRSKPKILTQEQFTCLLDHIIEDYIRVIAVLSMCLGLGIYEVLGLKWIDINWETLTINICRGIVSGRIGEVKNEYREADTPIDPLLAEFLLDWKRKTEFDREEDWIFASPFMAGKSPYFSTAIRRKIHAAGERAGLAHLLKGEPTKILRHSYRSWLGSTDAPLPIIKDLMRHADIRTTFNEYGNGVPEPMREANSKVARMVLKSSATG